MTVTRPWRDWIEDVAEPVWGREDEDSWGKPYEWSRDLDEHIARLRDEDPRLDAGLRVAEEGGIGVLPTHLRENGYTSPLLALSYNGGDEDWIVITPRGGEPWIAEMVAQRLAPCDVEVHLTPSWTIRICSHA